MANAVGVSIGFLSNLERSQSGASIGIMRKLAQYFGLNILDLFNPIDGTGPLVRPRDRKSLEGGPGVQMELLASGKITMEPHLFRVAPGAGSGESYSHEGEEFLYLVRGRLDIELAGEEFQLRAGDSFYFTSKTQHRWSNPGKTETHHPLDQHSTHLLNVTTLDATAQAELVRRREASPAELVDAAILRIQKVNPQLNAVVWERFEKAREEARSAHLPDGPFTGVPFLTKDLGCTTAGEPDSGGSRFLKENGYIASVTTELARRIKAAGFINLGRTNSPEFGSVPTTEPLAWGPTRNPWDLTRTAAGSSGGSCAAVAALMVPVAHGSDGGGSIRIPSAACGLVGLKPTRGRINMWPSTEWISPVSVQGFQTRTVRDLAACMDFASGALPGDPMPPPEPARSYVSEVGASTGQLRIGLWNRLPATIEGTLRPRMPTSCGRDRQAA